MAIPGAANWQAQILQGIGAPVTPANLTFLNAWARAEGGSASNNPFNTTQPGYGALGNYNSVGVKNYGSPAGGIAATVATLNNGRYGNILSALRQGQSAQSAAQALANSPWGTGALVLRILGAPSAGLTAPSGGNAAPVLPHPSRALTPQALAILNAGNRMFGLSELPSSLLGSAPSRLPTPGASLPSSSALPPATLSTNLPPVKGSTLKSIEGFAAPYGLTITSTTGGKHAPHSYHYQGRAVDFGGSPQRMATLAKAALSHPGNWTEFIYTGPGNPGYSILQGRVIPNSQLPKSLYAEHLTHVHLAR